MKPALLLVWPSTLDFPVCRWNLERFKDYFDGIYIGFSEHHREEGNITNWIRESLPFCTFIDVTRTRSDWRDDAVNCILEKIDSEYVCFFEQDFLIKDHSWIKY